MKQSTFEQVVSMGAVVAAMVSPVLGMKFRRSGSECGLYHTDTQRGEDILVGSVSMAEGYEVYQNLIKLRRQHG